MDLKMGWYGKVKIVNNARVIINDSFLLRNQKRGGDNLNFNNVRSSAYSLVFLYERSNTFSYKDNLFAKVVANNNDIFIYGSHSSYFFTHLTYYTNNPLEYYHKFIEKINST